MRKPFKLPFIILSIVTAVLFVGLVVMAVIPMKNLGDATIIKQPFEDTGFGNFFKILFESKNMMAIILFIVGCVLGAGAIALLVFSFIFNRKTWVKLVCAGLSLIALFPIFYAVVFFGSADSDVPGLYQMMKTCFDGDLTGEAIYYLAFMIIAGIQIVLTIIAVIFGILYSRANSSRYSSIAQRAPAAVGEPVESPVVDSEYEEPEVEPVPVFTPEPEPVPEIEEKKEEPAPAPAPVEEKKEECNPLDAAGLTALLKEVVRDIVRDEIARNNVNQKEPANDNHTDNHSIVGATFGGPLVVQYFNGGINGVTPAQNVVPAPAAEPVKEEPAPAPVEEPKAEEAKPEPVKEEPAPAPAPVVAEPVKEEKKPEEPKEPKAPIVRIPFEERITTAEKEMQDNYNEIKNEILSWGVKSRVSNSGDTFRLHRKTYIKLTVAGKSLKLYFALNPDDYRDSSIPVQDAGEKNSYAEIPLVFKVKSGLSLRRCKQLIQDCMEKDGLEQGEIGSVNWVKELKAEMKAREKAEKK